MARLLDRLLAAAFHLAGVILLCLTASVLIEVVMRYLLSRPTRWAVEFSEYMLVYIAFLAGAWVLREEGHVKIEILIDILPARAQAVLHAVTSWVGVIVSGLFFWFSASFTREAFLSGEVLFRAVHVPLWAVLVVIPVGLLLLTLQFVRRAWRATFARAEGMPEEAGPPAVPGL
jgi:TRAP-type C4-dicarboxylate transport system permease small subunit